MTSRRRRRDRRARQSDHPEPPRQKPDKADKKELRRRTEFEARLKRLRRNRNILLAAFVVSLPFAVLCAPGPLDCKVPFGVFNFASAAVLGLALGFVLRIWRERREFERGAPAA